MSSIRAVIGVGPNDLEIPLVMFPSKEEAEEFTKQFPTEEKGWLAEEFSEQQGEYGFDDDDEEIIHPLYLKLFKDGNYYSGCGGCYDLRIREVEFGKPIVGWDLD